MRKLILLSLLFIPFCLYGATPSVPPDKELKTMARDSLLAFNKAVQEKSFAHFYEEQLSPKFQKQFSLDKFTAAFQMFIDKGYDISNIASSDPVFDTPPALDSNSVLVVKGHYPTKPNKVTFKLSYIYESSAWKMVGINVQAAPTVENTGKVPDDKGLKTLTRESLVLFNDSVQAKSFDNFYGKISKLWQKETTAKKLLETFQPFIDKDIDIAPITKLEPVFDGTPAVNEDGMLVIKGSYPTKPSKVFFTLKYIYEDDSWKLAGINVNVKPGEEKSDDDE